MSVRTQWALRLDCEKNGCDPVHEDNGRIFEVRDTPHKKSWKVNGHATQVVMRTVEVSEWAEVQ